MRSRCLQHLDCCVKNRNRAARHEGKCHRQCLLDNHHRLNATASSLALLRAFRSRNARHDAVLSEIVRDYSAVSTMALEAEVKNGCFRREEELKPQSLVLHASSQTRRFFPLSQPRPPTPFQKNQQKTRTAQLEKEAHELRAESSEASQLIGALRQEAARGARAAEAEKELQEARKEAAAAYKEKSRIAEEALENSRALAAARERNEAQSKSLEMAAKETEELRKRSEELSEAADAATKAAAASEEELRERLRLKEQAISRAAALESEVAELSRRLVELRTTEIERMNAVNEQCEQMLRSARSAARGAAALAAARGAATAAAVGGAASGFLERAFFGGRRSGGGSGGGGREAAAAESSSGFRVGRGGSNVAAAASNDDGGDDDGDNDLLLVPPPPPPSLLPDTLAACLPPHAGGAYAAAFDRSGKSWRRGEKRSCWFSLASISEDLNKEKGSLFFSLLPFFRKKKHTQKTGRALATAGADRVVRIWEPSSLAAAGAGGGAATAAGGRSSRGSGNGGNNPSSSSASVGCVGSLHGMLDTVTCLAFTCDGRGLLAGGEDRALRLWEVNVGGGGGGGAGNISSSSSSSSMLGSGRVRHTLTGHTAKVTCCSTSPADPRVALSAGSDRTVKLWDLRRGFCSQSLPCGSACHSAAFSADGVLVFTGHFDGGLRAW